MATFQVPWLNGEMSLNIPDENIETVVYPRELAVLGNPIDGVKAALEKPIGCPPVKDALTSSDRVALLVTDTMDSLMGPPHNVGPYLLDQFNAAGVPDEHITLIHAAGMHGHTRGRKRNSARAGYIVCVMLNTILIKRKIWLMLALHRWEPQCGSTGWLQRQIMC